MADEREPDDLRWFCPQCGFFQWPERTPADVIAGVKQGPIIDEDRCCAGCGCTCARMGEIRALLAKHGLHLVTDAERREMVQAKLDAVQTRAERRVLRAMGDAHPRALANPRSYGEDLAEACEAELARRGEKP